jgi:hypothetical protein
MNQLTIKGLILYEEPLVNLIGNGLISGLVLHSSHTQSYSVCINEGDIIRKTEIKAGLTGIDLT